MRRTVFQVRADLRQISLLKTNRTVSPGLMGAITGALNDNLYSDYVRRCVLYWLFRYNQPPMQELHTGDLKQGEKVALLEWVDFSEGYEPSERFIVEATLVEKATISALSANPEQLSRIPSELYITRAAMVLGGTIKDKE